MINEVSLSNPPKTSPEGQGFKPNFSDNSENTTTINFSLPNDTLNSYIKAILEVARQEQNSKLTQNIYKKFLPDKEVEFSQFENYLKTLSEEQVYSIFVKYIKKPSNKVKRISTFLFFFVITYLLLEGLIDFLSFEFS